VPMVGGREPHTQNCHPERSEGSAFADSNSSVSRETLLRFAALDAAQELAKWRYVSRETLLANASQYEIFHIVYHFSIVGRRLFGSKSPQSLD